MANQRARDWRLTIEFLVHTTEDCIQGSRPQALCSDEQQSPHHFSPSREAITPAQKQCSTNDEHVATATSKSDVTGSLALYQERLERLQEALDRWKDGSGIDML